MSIKISPRQTRFLLISLILVPCLLAVPPISIMEAGQDAWLSMILASFFGLLIGLLVSVTGSLAPDATFVELATRHLGVWLGKAVGLVFILRLALFYVSTLRLFTDFVSATALPRTPTVLTTLCVAAIASYAGRAGLEAIARSAEFIFPLVGGILLPVFLYTLALVRIDNLTPALERGFWPVLRGSLLPAGSLGEVVTLAMLVPFIEPRRLLPTAAVAVGASALILAITTTVLAGVFGPLFASFLLFPIYTLSQMLSTGAFVQRLDIVVATFWSLVILLMLSFLHWTIAYGLGAVFQIKDYRQIAYSVGLALAGCSVIFARNMVEFREFTSTACPLVNIILQLGLLLIIIAAASRSVIKQP